MGKMPLKGFVMSKKKVILGLVVITLAVFSVYVLGRTNRENRIDDTVETPAAREAQTLAGNWTDWVGTEFRFDDGNWESWFMGSFGSRGTYTTSNGTIVMELADINVSDEWTSYTQEPQIGTYSVSGGILALTFGDETRTFTRQ